MIKLDDNLLTELGLQSLPAEEKRALLRQIYETLEMRVGTTLARQMTDAQLDEFESFINNNDEAGALRWLESNFPNYKDVVSQEFEVLKGEVMQAAPQIVANAAQAHAATQPQQQMPAPHQQPQYQQPTATPQAPQLDYAQPQQYVQQQPQMPTQQPVYQQPVAQQQYYGQQQAPAAPAMQQQPLAQQPTAVQQPQTPAAQPQQQMPAPQPQPAQDPYTGQPSSTDQQFSQPL